MASDNAELEQSRYSWLQAAQAAEKRVEVLEGLLRNLRNVFPHSAWAILEKVDAALSVGVEPKCCTPTAKELKLIADGDYRPEELWGIDGKPTCPDCHKVDPVEQTQGLPDEALCEFYDVSDWSGLVRELVGHVALLQDSAKRNVKPWDDTFPPTLLPAYIARVNAENALRQPKEEPVAWRVQRITPTGHPRLDLPILTLTQPPARPAWKAEPLYIHPSPDVAFDPGCPGGDWSN